MKSVFKWQFNPDSMVLNLRLPEGAKLIHVAEQHGSPTLWFEGRFHPTGAAVDGVALESRRFTIMGTGPNWSIEDSAEHVGSIIDTEGFVWHLYEIAAT